jgi:hypothetical protein
MSLTLTMTMTRSLRRLLFSAAACSMGLSPLAGILLSGSIVRAQTTVPRPPQFVLLAFDGSKSNQMWDESRAFAADLSQRLGKPVKFTYFINSSYYVPSKSEFRRSYFPPGKQAGSSAIGWGGAESEVRERIINTMKANKEGHEIASHAVGHFDAGAERWSQNDWQSEFEYFSRTMFGLLDLNPFRSSPSQDLPSREQTVVGELSNWLERSLKFVGFRAPQLGHTPGLWPVLEQFGFRYDTSKAVVPDRQGNYPWPTRNAEGSSFWDFALAQIEFVGGIRSVPITVDGRQYLFTIGKKPNSRIHSMDYNFYVNQNTIHAVDGDPWHPLAVYNPQDQGRVDLKGNPIKRRAKALDAVPEEIAKELETEILDSYKKYFATTYNGNRAPVHIGHHFSKWNHAAYWNAMKAFAEQVCGMEEVQCVTYAELADFMDNMSSKHLALSALQKGTFARGGRTDIADRLNQSPAASTVNVAFVNSRGVIEKVMGPDAESMHVLNGASLPVVSWADLNSGSPSGGLSALSQLTINHQKGKAVGLKSVPRSGSIERLKPSLSPVPPSALRIIRNGPKLGNIQMPKLRANIVPVFSDESDQRVCPPEAHDENDE